jgi:hypothetical protein
MRMVDVTTRNLRIKIPVEFLVYPEWVGGWVVVSNKREASPLHDCAQYGYSALIVDG